MLREEVFLPGKSEGSMRKSLVFSSHSFLLWKLLGCGERPVSDGSLEGKAKGIAETLTQHPDVSELLSNPEPRPQPLPAGKSRACDNTTLEGVKSWLYHSLELGQSA